MVGKETRKVEPKQSEKTIVSSCMSGEKEKVGRDHVIKLTSQGDSSST